jgi:arabinofuranosyltransferase
MTPTGAAQRALPPRLWPAVLATLPALVVLAWGASTVSTFVSDDAFISLRYSQRLLDGDGLTWTDGERVEGYSNLAWVLLTALVSAFGIDLVAAARGLGAVLAAATLFVLARASAPDMLGGALSGARAVLRAAVAPLLFATAQTTMVWTCAGLEGPLYAFGLALGFTGVAAALRAHVTTAGPDARRLLLLGLPFALVVWTRPDGPLWALTVGTTLAIVWRTRAVRTAVLFGLPAALAFALQLGFRLAYHGDVVPNTAHVKAGFDPAALPAGLDYVLRAVQVMPGSFAAALAGALLILVLPRATGKRFVLVAALPLAAWGSYLVAIGGDHFPGRRLLHGALVPLSLIAAEALAALASRAALTHALGIAAGITFAAIDAVLAHHDPQTAEVRQEIWEWRGKVIGEALGAAFGDAPPQQRPLLAVDAAGAVPFYSRLPALDLLGLCDRTIATTAQPEWLATMRADVPRPAGHLKGNGDYVMRRAPDLMLFANPPGLPLPVFVSALEFEDDPRFLNGYRCVLLELRDREILPDRRETLRVPLWVRLEGRVGISRTADEIRIPAWLFGSLDLPGPVFGRHQAAAPPPDVAAARNQALATAAAWYASPGAVAVPTAEGSGLALELRGESRAALRLPIARGVWRWRAEPADAAIDLQSGSAAVVGTFEAADGASMDLAVRGRQAGLQRVATIVLERVR